MAYFFDTNFVNVQSRSGVHLDYTPEDTLKSFIMEKRLTPIPDDENAPTPPDSNSNNLRPAKSLKFYPTAQTSRQPPKFNQNVSRPFEKPPEQEKRQFLRKNQGRSAWCSRLRSSMTKLQEYSTRMRTVTSNGVPSLNRMDSEEHDEAIQSKIDSLCPVSFSNRQTKIYTHESKWNPLPQQPLFPISREECCDLEEPPLPTENSRPNDIKTNPKAQSVYVAAGATLNDLSDNGELEEFELLERFAENQVYEGSSKSGVEVHPPSMVRKRSGVDIGPAATVAAPMTAGDINDFNDNWHIGKEEEKKDLTVNQFLRNPFVDKQMDAPPPQPKSPQLEVGKTSVNGICLASAESVSSVFDDNVPWKEGEDEEDVELTGIGNTLQDSMELFSTHQQTSMPSVRFNLPTPLGSSLCTSNAPKVEGDSSLEGAPTPSSNVIKEWISRLESEVNRFNTENAALVKLKAEREEAIVALEKAKKEFEKYRETTVKEFTVYRQEEIGKLKKERKVLADYHRSLQSMPNKRDREEIERLKQQISDEKAEAAQRETRLQQQANRQRSRIEDLTSEKAELLERIKRLEQARFSLQNTLTEERAKRALKLPPPPSLATLSEDRSKEARDNSDSTFATCKTQSQIDTVSQGLSFQPHTRNLVSQMVNRLQNQKQQAPLPHQKNQHDQNWHSSIIPPNGPSSPPPSANGFLAPQSTTTSDDLAVVLPPSPSAADSVTEANFGRSLPPPPPPPMRALRRVRSSSVASDYYTGEEDCSSADTLGIHEGLPGFRFPGTSPRTRCQPVVTQRPPQRGRPQRRRPIGPGSIMGLHQLKSVPLPHFSRPTSSPLLAEQKRGPMTREICHPDGSLERQYCDGSKVIKYANGSRKEIFPDGLSSLVNLFNGDSKRTLSDGTVIYFYATEGTVQTTYHDGTEEVVYRDGRKEVKYPNRSAAGHPRSSANHANSSAAASVVVCSPVPSRPSHARTMTPPPAESTNGSARASPPAPPRPQSSPNPIVIEESHPGEGIAMRIFSNGDKIITLANGQKEVHCGAFKRRIYPDGTLKTVFKDGRQETCYASGRIRVKDGLGNLLVDTRIAPLSQAAGTEIATLVMPPHLVV